MIFLETKRLILRNVQPKDADTIFEYRNDERCARYQRGQTKDLAGIQTLTEKRAQDVLGLESNCFVAMENRETGEMVGEIVVMPGDGCFTLGYTVSWRHHRKGYAFEALSALTEYLHETYPEQEFICFTDPKNEPSMALLRKLGYENYGYVEKIDSNVFGKWIVGDPLK